MVMKDSLHKLGIFTEMAKTPFHFVQNWNCTSCPNITPHCTLSRTSIPWQWVNTYRPD